VVHTSCTKGLEPVPETPFIIDPKGDGTLVVVVRAFFLSAVSASLFPFLNLSFSTSCTSPKQKIAYPLNLIEKITKDPVEGKLFLLT